MVGTNLRRAPCIRLGFYYFTVAGGRRRGDISVYLTDPYVPRVARAFSWRRQDRDESQDGGSKHGDVPASPAAATAELSVIAS